MAISPTSYETGYSSYIKDIGLNGFEETAIDNISSSFEISPNYEDVYIVNDSSENQDFLHNTSFSNDYGLTKYKSWIYDGTEDEQTVGHKYIQMYPYATPVLCEGDYVCWDYFKTGIKSTWLVIALDSQTIYEQIAKIRMCTNELRFYNDYGELVKIPCVFDNKINSEKNVSVEKMKYINGITTIYAQINSDSTKIKPNQRFLFGRQGNWVSFRVTSVGVNNFMNLTYDDNDSARVLELTMEASYVNDMTDDLVNGIADVNTYTIVANQSSVENIIGTSINLEANVLKNGEIITESVLWETSNALVASISQSGVLELISNGSATITVSMTNNVNVKTTIGVVVANSITEDNGVVIEPYGNGTFGVLQGSSQTFTCYLYKNGVAQSDTFSFTSTTLIDGSDYTFVVIDGNSFSIKNIKMNSVYTIKVTCTSGIHTKDIIIRLKGVW